MKAQARWSTDAFDEALNMSEKLDMQKPDLSDDESYYEYGDAYFDIEKVTCFNIDTIGDIRVFLNDASWTFKYTKELWDKLIERYG